MTIWSHHGKQTDDTQDAEKWSDLRLEVARWQDNHYVQICINALVLLSLVLLVIETDTAADDGDSPLWISIISRTLVMIFVLETAARIFVLRTRYFREGYTVEFLIVFVDFGLSVSDIILGTIPSLAWLRTFRLLRVLRVLKVIRIFPELGYLLNGMASSFFAISWGLVMVLIIMFVWSIIGVQVIHPVSKTVVREHPGRLCDRCAAGFSSTWNSLVTLTQTLLIGDSWGATAIPIIDQEFWTFFLFLFSYATVALAALNLILAAIVDSGQNAREEAQDARRAKERLLKAQADAEHLAYLKSLCRDIDVDDSGYLSKEELLGGFDNNPKFKAAMKDKGYERVDLEVLFRIVDGDDSGEVNYSKFLSILQESRNEDINKTVAFIKFAVTDMWKRHEERQDKMQLQLDTIANALTTLANNGTCVRSADGRAASEGAKPGRCSGVDSLPNGRDGGGKAKGKGPRPSTGQGLNGVKVARKPTREDADATAPPDAEPPVARLSSRGSDTGSSISERASPTRKSASSPSPRGERRKSEAKTRPSASLPTSREESEGAGGRDVERDAQRLDVELSRALQGVLQTATQQLVQQVTDCVRSEMQVRSRARRAHGSVGDPGEGGDGGKVLPHDDLPLTPLHSSVSDWGSPLRGASSPGDVRSI